MFSNSLPEKIYEDFDPESEKFPFLAIVLTLASTHSVLEL